MVAPASGVFLEGMVAPASGHGVSRPIPQTHGAPVPNPTIRHSERKCAHFSSECIVGYGTGALLDMWILSIDQKQNNTQHDQACINHGVYCLCNPVWIIPAMVIKFAERDARNSHCDEIVLYIVPFYY